MILCMLVLDRLSFACVECKMRPTNRDNAWSVCPLGTTMGYIKTDEPIEIPLWVWTRVGSRDHELGGTRTLHGNGQFWAGVSGPLRNMGNIWLEPTLFARWQQRCGLSANYFDHLFFLFYWALVMGIFPWCPYSESALHNIRCSYRCNY